MKFDASFHRTVFSTLLSLLLFAAPSLAAANPHNQPKGLAADSHGNLYVANPGANQVLVYNPNFQQITTISQFVNTPR